MLPTRLLDSCEIIPNDYCYESVFSCEAESAGEVLKRVGYLGNSKNVVEALRCARTLGAFMIALTCSTRCTFAFHNPPLRPE